MNKEVIKKGYVSKKKNNNQEEKLTKVRINWKMGAYEKNTSNPI